MHGFSRITALMISRLREVTTVEAIDISPDRLIRDWHYHAQRLRRVWRAGWRIMSRGPSRNCTLYFAVSGGSGVVYDVFLLLLARIRRYQIFIHHHAFTYINCRSWWMAGLVAVAGTGATHICLCNTMAERLRAQYASLFQVEILSNAALITPAQCRLVSKTDVIRIGFLSNLIPEKGLDTVIEVFRALRQDIQNIVLVIAGPATDQATRFLIDAVKQEFGGAVDYRGPIYDTQKDAFFSDVDIFLFPTRYPNEAQPLVVLEALAAGVPVIATARGCIAEDLVTGGIVVFPEMDFVSAAVRTITEWLGNPAGMGHLCTTALERAEKLHGASRHELARLIGTMVAPGNRYRSRRHRHA
jgi:glycosyltransferase involved in cell wall biosynthesis